MSKLKKTFLIIFLLGNFLLFSISGILMILGTSHYEGISYEGLSYDDLFIVLEIILMFTLQPVYYLFSLCIVLWQIKKHWADTKARHLVLYFVVMFVVYPLIYITIFLWLAYKTIGV